MGYVANGPWKSEPTERWWARIDSDVLSIAQAGALAGLLVGGIGTAVPGNACDRVKRTFSAGRRQSAPNQLA